MQKVNPGEEKREGSAQQKGLAGGKQEGACSPCHQQKYSVLKLGAYQELLKLDMSAAGTQPGLGHGGTTAQWGCQGTYQQEPGLWEPTVPRWVTLSRTQHWGDGIHSWGVGSHLSPADTSRSSQELQLLFTPCPRIQAAQHSWHTQEKQSNTKRSPTPFPLLQPRPESSQ